MIPYELLIKVNEKIALETRFSAVRYAHHTANITMQSCQYLSPSGRCRIDGRTFLHYIEARRRGPRETASQHFVGAPNQINTQVHLPMHVQYIFVWNHAYYYLR